ncbi:MAG: sulfate adenylyltransferase subunit CysD [Gammaproteobacteria bacterium]|nr:sulfate adenylyltransferase subunit CysD [Gammaproteobacteria bacterium]
MSAAPAPLLASLEAESIHILREALAEAAQPVLLFSLGKDSCVLLELARRAFYPAALPFPLLHIDTSWKFREMYTFRERVAGQPGLELRVHRNEEAIARGVTPFTHGPSDYTALLKTTALRAALDHFGFDLAIGGARRDEDPVRAKERIFSLRSAQHGWEPRAQRAEPWSLYNGAHLPGESVRVFPLSNWTELDVWRYIRWRAIEVVPLYFAAERSCIERQGQLLVVDDARMPLAAGERPAPRQVRFRTLGCYPLTAAMPSAARTVDDIIAELESDGHGERRGRLIDHDAPGAMERKKLEGYF